MGADPDHWTTRQSFEWIAAHADGWVTYPRDLARQAELVAKWRAAVEAVSPGVFKPFVQSLYVDLADKPAKAPRPIHLGFRAGRNFVAPQGQAEPLHSQREG